MSGFWYGHKGQVTNLNIYGLSFFYVQMNNKLDQLIRSITEGEMKRLTSSEDCAELKDEDSIYFSWTMMKWKITGEVKEYKIPRSDLCSNVDTSISVSAFFPSKIHLMEC